MPVQLRMVTEGGKIQIVGKEQTLIPKSGKIEGAFFVEMPENQLNGRKTPIKMELVSDGRVIDEITTNFMGPSK